MNSNDVLNSMLEVYIVKAAQANWIVVDGKYAIVSDEGKKQMDSILTTCVQLMVDSGEDITGTTKTLNETLNTNHTDIQIMAMILKQLVGGSETKLLAFLIAEQEADFKYLKETLQSTSSVTKRKLSVVPGKKYDA
jgi:hypothetical protein